VLLDESRRENNHMQQASSSLRESRDSEANRDRQRKLEQSAERLELLKKRHEAYA
jgi:hypothetical protein